MYICMYICVFINSLSIMLNTAM